MLSASILGRYRVEETPIGHGGMGVVYKAFDDLTKRYVALKTLKGDVEPSCIEMFQREWMQLAQLSHPNIVDVLDIGDFIENGQHRPYFVMPLLQGCTLDALIKGSGSKLTPERIVEILCQTCRGLQAAHDRGLIHRDLKPSNLFVMADDTVKIIDFGIVHLVDTQSRTGVKGTLQYMAPEQLEMKPASARSDIFSLGVVCYEALTGRKPFDRGTAEEVIDAIRGYMPPPVSELNPSANQQVSRAVQKAMAKQPYHRFASAREFSDILQRSLRNEAIEIFDIGRIQPRINRIKKALTDNDYQLATDMLDEIESEGNIAPEITILRVKTEQASRSRTIYQLIESARTRMEEQEYPLALQNIQRVLDLDSSNVDALALKGEIERQRSSSQIEKWLQLARQQLDERLFEKARQAVDEVRKVDHANPQARDLLAEINRGEQEIGKIRQEKQRLYDSALQGYRNGELSSALSKLQKVLELGKRAPGHPATDAQYMALYEQIRSEHDELHNAYVEGRKALEAHNFARALEICQEVLSRRPGEPLFQALKFQVEDIERQENSARIAELHRQIGAELDLDRKYGILTEAVKEFPDEKLFSQSLKLVKERRDLVKTIIARARHYESQRQFAEAANQWDIIRNIYPQYPGIEYELQRLTRKQEEYGKEEVKAVWIDKIDRALFSRDFQRAEDLMHSALLESPDDPELIRLKEQIAEASEISAKSNALLDEGEKLARSNRRLEAIEKLRLARSIDEGNTPVRDALMTVLVEYAEGLAKQDWRSAVPFVEEALAIEPSDPGAGSVARLIEDMRQREDIERFLRQARELQANRNLAEAIQKVEEGLRQYPNEIRLSQLRNTLHAASELQTPTAEAILASQETNADAPDDMTRYLSIVPVPEPLTETQPADPVIDPPVFGQRSTLRNRREIEPESNGSGLRLKILVAVAALVIVVGAIFLFQRAQRSKPLTEPPPVATSANSPVPAITANKDASTRLKQDVPVPTNTAPVVPKARPSDMESFDFQSDPPGARVSVDDRANLTCTTPCDLQLAPGQHSISYVKPGYDPLTRSVLVPGEFSDEVHLTPRKQTVRIISQPFSAALTIDGEQVGPTPITVTLAMGKHKITLTKDDQTINGTMDVVPDRPVITLNVSSSGQLDGEPATAAAPQQ